MLLVESNHGSLVYRRGKAFGLPRHVLKAYGAILEAPTGWKWFNDLIVTCSDGNKVYICHGRASDGLKLSQSLGMSCVQGHFHERFEARYWSSKAGLFWSVIAGCLIGDLWYMPAGNSYAAHIFQDAQFDYQEKKSKGTGSVSFSLEHCLNVHKNASVWIDPGVSSLQSLARLNPKYRFLDAYSNKEVYCYSHRANYYWENSASEPQHVLSDFIAINKGEASKKKLYFYRKL
jgi:hypothetical protein